MFAYNTQTAAITYIKNFLVEVLRGSLIKRMEFNNTLDPRQIDTREIYRDLDRDQDLLRDRFKKNLNSISQIPEKFSKSSINKKALERLP